MKKRDFLGLLGASAVAPLVLAQKGDPFVIAINEGVTYKGASGTAADRFGDLAGDLQKLLRRPVRVQAVEDYKDLAKGLAESRYDLAYVHPAHHSIRAMTRSGYQLVALTKGFTEYRASFMVNANSPLKTLADLKGQKVGAPSEDSITSVISRATLKESLGTLPELTYVRYQDAVPFMVEHGLSACGVSASRAVVKAWQDKGGRVLHTSKPVPIKHLIASAKVPAAQRGELAAYFVGLDMGAEGKRRLETLNVPGFLEFDQAAIVGIGTWLGV